MNPMQAPNVGVGGKDHGKRDHRPDFGPVCVVSKHPKGFWMADVYIDGETESSPDWYCTGKNRGQRKEVIDKALSVFPGIKVVDGRFFEA